MTCAVAGLLAELVFKSGDYRDAKKAVLSYGLFSTWIFGNYLPLFTDYEGYFAQRADYGQAYIDAVQKLMPLCMAPVLLIACFVCGIIGGLLGRVLIFCTVLWRNPDTLCGDDHDGRVCHSNYICQ